MSFWRDVNAPDTAWRASSEDPIPLALGRSTVLAAVYRWFALRPLDGHARSNATFFTGGTQFYSRSGAAPFPGAWFHSMPRWKQALFTRVPWSAWLLSFPGALIAHVLTWYLSIYASALMAVARIVWKVLTW